MKNSILISSVLVFSVLTLLSATMCLGQQSKPIIEKEIQKLDSLFWEAYNNCKPEDLKKYISPDVEFYHDKGGITLGEPALTQSIKTNLCSNPAMRVRREAIKESMKVHLMQKGDEIYGALITGDHFFYVTETGKPEKREGVAKFSNLWILKNGTWQMSRIFSYDHGPAVNYVKK